MAGKVAFELVSPEKLLVATEADMVTVPGSEGDFGVLPGHAATISTLRPGVITVDVAPGDRSRYMVEGGFVEVAANRCTVLVDAVTPLGELSIERIEARQKQAEEALADAAGEAEKKAAASKLAVVLDLKRAFIHYAAN